ncbi:hypothetical protein RVR_9692 [Actinacidiphila reveromycinica]|uniref:Knr4/Smi1-like domain-containing protein n=1 Tax=Actinacidiphila reveromycinica TaxID=659352 RepID=A0A7U3V037_9ACTN|nr:hypothetical protein [Streptomyces sp. SN-593]BBB02011.1 hypothetical protein RVR_9692 [Streptomyces sp. SN-593]
MGRDNFVDGRAIGDFTATWRRVEDWLRVHAPEDFAALRGPASARDIAAVAEDFPPHPFLVALLSAHDGSELSSGAELLPRYGLLPAARMAGWRAAGAGCPEAEWWVPFAATSTGEYLVVDHRQGPGYGAVLRFDPESGAGGERCWHDLLALVAELADVLESGEPLRMPGAAAHRPCAGGQLGWEIVPSPEVPAVWLREVWRDAEKRLLRAAPAACASLRPPARPQEIRSAETPDPFHAHLRAFLLLHDGADGPDGFEVFPGGYRPYGCAELCAARASVKAAVPDTAIRVRVRTGTKTAGGRESAVERAHGHGEASSSPADLPPVPTSWLPFAVSREGAELLLCQEQGESYGAVLAWDQVARDYRTVHPDLAALCERVGR